MRTEEEIRKELDFRIKQGFNEYGINERQDVFNNGYITALSFVLETEQEK